VTRVPVSGTVGSKSLRADRVAAVTTVTRRCIPHMAPFGSELHEAS